MKVFQLLSAAYRQQSDTKITFFNKLTVVTTCNNQGRCIGDIQYNIKMLTSDIIRILMAGASVHIDCKKHTVSDLLMMANVAKVHKRRIFFEKHAKICRIA